MDTIGFALELELAIEKTLTEFRPRCTDKLFNMLDMLVASQQEFVNVLTQADVTTPGRESFPVIETVRVVGAEETWRLVTATFRADEQPETSNITVLWSVCACIDRSAQFYAQAAQNSASPQSRLFFGSLAELKQMLRRKVDGILRVNENQVWSVVGFPPGRLSKE